MRKKNLFFQILICIVVAGLTLYIHMEKSNQLTAIQLAIPQLQKEVRALQLENERLQYEIDQFESPIHLMNLLRKPEYSHLKYPLKRDVVVLPKGKGNES